MRLLCTTLLSACAGIALATQAADFNLTAADAAKYDCTSECQAEVAAAEPADLGDVGSDFDFAFYATASNFTKSLAPGEILKSEMVDANKLSLLSGVTVYRIQYTSVDLDGSVVPVTGFVALPQVNYRAKDGKFPVVAYAHGTIGLFSGCAPSNGPALYDYYTWQPVSQRGYAIVATDYAGLGNNYTTHKYLSLVPHAADVYYSVVAARKAFFGHMLADEWMSAGHSQGGGAAWKLAESKFVANDSSYLGTVAMAPATYVVDMFLDNLNGTQFAGYLTYLPFAVQRGVPGFNTSFVGKVMQKRVELAEKLQVCLRGMFALTAGIAKNDLLDPAGLESSKKQLLEWQNKNTPARGGKSPAPILVIQGLADRTVQATTTEEAWRNACSAGNELHLRLYEGQDHSPSIQAAGPEWLGWIDDRFGGRSLGSSSKCSPRCTKETRALINKQLTNVSKQRSGD